MKKDPTAHEHVSSLLPGIRFHHVRGWIGAVALTLAVACGGGQKGKTTPDPKAGSGSQSMNDPGDPTGGTGGTGGTTGGGPTGGGPTGGGPTGGGPTGGGPTGTVDPPFTPPNYDPDPATVKMDFEFNHRAARAGMTCFFTPRVGVKYVPRDSLSRLFNCDFALFTQHLKEVLLCGGHVLV